MFWVGRVPTQRVKASRAPYMDEPKYSVKVLEKVVKILNLYTYNEGSFTLDQISKKAALSKTTAFRILKTLEKPPGSSNITN